VRDGRGSGVSARTAATLALLAALVLPAAAPGIAATAAGAEADAAPSGPAATPTEAPEGGDARSSGEGAGLAGAPFLAIGVVATIGAGSALATLGYVRLTRRGGSTGP
jgi:hypothetical protein